jgi:hypothetical protein
LDKYLIVETLLKLIMNSANIIKNYQMLYTIGMLIIFQLQLYIFAVKLSNLSWTNKINKLLPKYKDKLKKLTMVKKQDKLKYRTISGQLNGHTYTF